MKEYIERAAIHELVKRIPKYEMFNYDRTEALLGINPDDVDFGVDKIPTADVVEVTFCKDCRYYQDAKVNEKGFLICPASGMEITVTDFCSYGRRKIETILPKSDAKVESLEETHANTQKNAR